MTLSHSPAAIAEIFASLQLTYGRDFLDQYIGLELELVHGDWVAKLEGIPSAAILWAIDNLKAGKPPNALVFAQWCREYREPASRTKALAPPVDPRKPPEELRPIIRQLSMPIEDDRPERVRVASRYLASRGPGVKLTPREAELCKHYRSVLDDYEADLRRKAEATELAKAALAGGSHAA